MESWDTYMVQNGYSVLEWRKTRVLLLCHPHCGALVDQRRDTLYWRWMSILWNWLRDTLQEVCICRGM